MAWALSGGMKTFLLYRACVYNVRVEPQNSIDPMTLSTKLCCPSGWGGRPFFGWWGRQWALPRWNGISNPGSCETPTIVSCFQYIKCIYTTVLPESFHQNIWHMVVGAAFPGWRFHQLWIYINIYLEPKWSLYFLRATPQNEAFPIQKKVIWVPGIYPPLLTDLVIARTSFNCPGLIQLPMRLSSARFPNVKAKCLQAPCQHAQTGRMFFILEEIYIFLICSVVYMCWGWVCQIHGVWDEPIGRFSLRW